MRAVLIMLIVLSSNFYGCSSSSSNGSNTSATGGGAASALVSAFNIQIFGVSKMGEPQVVDVLVDIVRRYDLILIQEIRDISETAIHELLNLVNNSGGEQYALILGPRAGRTSSKEQYAYIYKPSVITILGQLEFDDGLEPDQDTFEREPFIVYASFPGLDVILIPLHSKPSDAVLELDALVGVYETAAAFFQDDDAIILGDLNADCSFVSASDWATISLRNDSRFVWLIEDDVDTTTSSTDCAYDRFVVTSGVSGVVEANSPSIFDYQAAFQLNSQLTLDVSDHYPIEMRILSPN